MASTAAAARVQASRSLVGVGFLAAPGPLRLLPVSPSTAGLGLLPLVLIPTTAVPLAFALHVASLRRLRTAPVAEAQLAAVAA